MLPGPALPAPGPGPADLLRLSARTSGRGVIVVDLDGEIDLSTAPQLVATLRTLPIPAPGLLVLLDLSSLDFCDVTGLNTLLRSGRMLAERGARLALAAPPQPLVKMLEITGLGEYFEVFPSLPAAGISPTARPVRCDIA